MRKCWSKEESELLIKLYTEDGMGLKELYPIFSGQYKRSIVSVGVKIRKLKLIHTKEQLRKIKSKNMSGENNPMYGKSVMTGLTKENSEMIRLSAIKTSNTRKELYKLGLLPSVAGDKNPMYGKPSWCRGLTKFTDNRLREYGRKVSIIKNSNGS